MTTPPYTDDDLRVEAARQHYTATTDPDFVGIGEQMDGSFIDSTVIDPDPEQGTEPLTGRKWDDLAPHEFGEAQRAIDDLLGGAADVSEWAINLGADGLEPDGYTLQLGESDSPDGNDRPRVRLHFAFHPDMDDDARHSFVMELSKVVLRNL